MGKLRVLQNRSMYAAYVRNTKKVLKTRYKTSIRTVNNNVLISIALKIVLTLISKFKTRNLSEGMACHLRVFDYASV